MKRPAVAPSADRTIFLVSAFYDHDVTVPLHAFSEAAKAETFRKECEDYRAKRPECPSAIEDSQENDRQWDRYFRRDAQFRRKHLAGEHAGCDSFSVVEVPLCETRSPDR